MIKKKIAVVSLLLAIIFLAVAPESFACHRHRRTYASRRYRAPYARVASDCYVNPSYRSSGMGSKTRTALTIAAPAAIGAGLGALFGGKKGAGIGALLGGGGGAAYHLLKHRNRY
ncbi:MAG: hypothetical protein HY231_13190 [Acidobacteria bacterium]|nr:hypothetical protein [Acidobacteriota bacterium]